MVYLPIIYVRGYAGTQSEIESTVDDPFYGLNKGSTHVRIGPKGDAQFFAFESPLLRMITDHEYEDVFEGGLPRCEPTRRKDPNRIIWIYRYYDPASKTFKKEGEGRLSMEDAAEGLRQRIKAIKKETKAQKVILIAHSMGGLVCRCLIQKIYPDNNENPTDHIDKLFTYGTPHGGIHFELGGGTFEWIRDQFGWNNSDDFGRERMYEYLTPEKDRKKKPPKNFQPYAMDDNIFPLERVFCVVGTNASDYEVLHGLSRKAVGIQSDGLVQIKHAYVKGANRAYIHRSHSGRYGMVNSEEGYQNLQRFLFGDIKVKVFLCQADLPAAKDTFYQAEAKVALRGLPIIMHEQVSSHFCPISLEADGKNDIPLFSAFLISSNSLADDKRTSRYSIYLAIHSFKEKEGWFFCSDTLEQVPLWGDYLIVDLRKEDSGYKALYSWTSDTTEPDQPMDLKDHPKDQGGWIADIPLPQRAERTLGKAKIRLAISPWE